MPKFAMRSNVTLSDDSSTIFVMMEGRMRIRLAMISTMTIMNDKIRTHRPVLLIINDLDEFHTNPEVNSPKGTPPEGNPPEGSKTTIFDLS